MANGGAEDPSFAVGIGPDADLILLGFAAFGGAQGHALVTLCHHLVQLALRGFPGLRKFGQDRVVFAGVPGGHHLKGIVGPVAMRGDAAELEPFAGAIAIAVHAAVDQHAGQTLPVGFDDGFGPFGVLGIGEALVVHHDVVALVPVGLLIERDLAGGGGTALVDHHPLDAGPGGGALGDDQLLRLVVMAAAAGDQERLQVRIFGFGAKRQGAECGKHAISLLNGSYRMSTNHQPRQQPTPTPPDSCRPRRFRGSSRYSARL